MKLMNNVKVLYLLAKDKMEKFQDDNEPDINHFPMEIRNVIKTSEVVIYKHHIVNSPYEVIKSRL